MKINTALILCAGLGERLKPLTLETPKPLLKINNSTILECCIDLIIKLKIKKVIINTFHLNSQIENFITTKKFPIDIKIVNDGKRILNTGGGILNMISNSMDKNFLIFNPDTIWKENYISEIEEMQNLFFSKKLNNILLTVKKNLSFDKTLNGDFNLKDNLLEKKNNGDFIYIGCQILNKDLFTNYRIENFPISYIWNMLLKKEKLNGYESFNKFHHLTNLEIFKKLKDL
tara:strand:+ start:562 stop:1251 length:690 start_codon:yes stop_codon:yes gene_type:complete